MKNAEPGLNKRKVICRPETSGSDREGQNDNDNGTPIVTTRSPLASNMASSTAFDRGVSYLREVPFARSELYTRLEVYH
jgi:hypothetical protein